MLKCDMSWLLRLSPVVLRSHNSFTSRSAYTSAITECSSHEPTEPSHRSCDANLVVVVVKGRRRKFERGGDVRCCVGAVFDDRSYPSTCASPERRPSRIISSFGDVLARFLAHFVERD